MRALCFAAIVCLALTVGAQGKSGAQTLVEKQIASYTAAMKKRDLRGVEAVMADDYTVTSADGHVVKRAESVETLRQILRDAKSVDCTCKIQTFKMEKGNARLKAKNSMDIVFMDAGKEQKYHNESVTDETWIPVNGTYLIKLARELSSKTTLNGKPLPPSR